MKQLNVTYNNGENDLWYIPMDKEMEKAVKEIEEETELTIIKTDKVKGW